MGKTLTFVVISMCYGFVASYREAKTWSANTDFSNPRNWQNGHKPCYKDRIVFGYQDNVVMFLPDVASFSDMVLPLNGEFLFSEGASLFGSPVQSSCEGEVVQFVTNVDSWYDPYKWNITSPYAYPPVVSAKNNAVPHALRLPCKTDLVVFPKSHAFTVHLEGSPVTVGALKINDISFSNEEFQSMLTSRTGNLLFPGNPRIAVSGHGCDDATGCSCGNDDPKVFAKICSKVKCPSVECADPIKPKGHCCFICGAYLLMEYEMGFEINRLMGFLTFYLSKNDFQNVHSFTTKIEENLIQTVFVDVGKFRGDANELSRVIYERLKRDLESSNQNRLKTLNIYSSGKWNAGVPTHQPYSGRGVSPGGTAAIVIIVILLGALLAWYIYRKRRIPGFSFVRFDLHASKVELELGTTPHEALAPEERATAFPHDAPPELPKAFDNPVYDTAAVSEEKKSPEHVEYTDEPQNIVENPMFVIFEAADDRRETSP